MKYVIAGLMAYIAIVQTVAATQADKHLNQIAQMIDQAVGELQLIRTEKLDR